MISQDSSSSTNLIQSRLRLLIPILVFVVALGLRLVGISWGLKNELHNQSYHPDEGDIFGYSQQIEPAHLKFTPGFYNYGTLYLTTLRVASDMTAAYTGGFDPKSEASLWSYVARCNLAGRIISAILGAATAVVVFGLVKRFAGLLGGLAAAAIVGFAPAHVVHSRFQTVDVMAVFLLAASTYFSLLLIPIPDEEAVPEKNRLKWIALAGIFAGLSGGTKYTGLLTVLSLVVVLFACHRKSIVKDLAIGLGCTLAAFIVATPGVVLDSDRFLRDFTYEMRHTASGHGLVFEGTPNGFIFHVLNLFQGFGTIATLIGLIALCYAAYRRQTWALALLAFVVPYYILIGRAEAKFMRYTFPLYVGLSAGFGWAIAKGQEQKGAGKALVAGGILAVGGVDLGGLRGAVLFTSYMVSPDPRDEAARYLKTLASGKPNYLVGLPEDPWFWSAPLFPESTASRGGGTKGRERRDKAMNEAIEPRVTYFHNPDGSPTQFDRRLLSDMKPDAVSYSSFEFEDPERLTGREDISDTGKAISKQYHSFVDELKSGYTPDRVFGDRMNGTHDMEYIQPQVVVWKRKGS